jgi:hypothetical protein
MIILQKHLAVTWKGEEVEIGQWQILRDGVLIGYLPHEVDSRILPVVGFPYEIEAEVVRECELQRAMFDERKSIVLPPTHELKEVEDVLKAQVEEQEQDGDDQPRIAE